MAYYTRLASIYSFLILPYGPTAMGSYLRRLSSRETKSDHSKKREQRLYRDKAGTVLKRSRYQSCGDYRFNDPSLCLHYCQNEQQLRGFHTYLVSDAIECQARPFTKRSLESPSSFPHANSQILYNDNALFHLFVDE
ncbi:hypothetical protein GGQ95_002474 [Anoxybacillus rupiensis]|nr:hypothetical protein [Anoxybacillus rupiensis]